ncbi:MAG: preprotein translocase subunit SecA [Planctomycetes bacterium]|nr:preprotein translocase subunit SecA [Planctomycetota bacterium]
MKPDDYFRHGPIEMARFGKFIFSQSNLSKDQFEEMQNKLVERFPEVCREIDDKISEIVTLIRKLPPGELLKRAYWEMAARHINKKSEVDIGFDEALSLRMIDYIQSVIASVQPEDKVDTQVAEDQWRDLRALVEALFSQLNLEYQICLTAFNRRVPGYNQDFEEYYFKAQVYWCNIRGRRYLVHQIPFFRDVLSPHNEVLNELYGISADELLDALKQIQDSLTLGFGKLMEDMHQFRQATTTKLEEKIQAVDLMVHDNLCDLMTTIIEENGWEDWKADIFGRFAGLDLFDLEKITKLPKVLLDLLSWEPGQETDFLKEGEYKGWPLRIWPIFKRPFIKLKGRYYCFELFSLYDNLYRTIQHVILQIKPEYRQIWNDKQQELSERIPLQLLGRLLPGATVLNSIYYFWHASPGKSKGWCEADALLIYEDHLFIIEIKAGAFTYTPPATDFQAYIESLKNLVIKPAEQGKRFLEYLRSDKEVLLYDSYHTEIGKISRGDFEHVTICAVTLDPFTELAAQVQHLKQIGIDVGAQPIWSISIDDLRVYADIFDNPLVFLHFVEERMRAFQSELIQTEDEIDHLGLYLKHNIYTQYAKELDPEGKIIWHGYRSVIDRYFTEKIHDQNTICQLKQEMPTRLKEIIDFLSASNKPKRRKVSSTILDTAGEWRENITSGIDDLLKQQSIFGKAKPLSTYGGTTVTIFCWQQGLLERNRDLALDHARAAMLITQDKERLLLELTFDDSNNLLDVNYSFIRLEDIPMSDIDRLKALGETIRLKRIEKAKKLHGEIGRNHYCPCGSGKKYKRCCLV